MYIISALDALFKTVTSYAPLFTPRLQVAVVRHILLRMFDRIIRQVKRNELVEVCAPYSSF